MTCLEAGEGIGNSSVRFKSSGRARVGKVNCEGGDFGVTGKGFDACGVDNGELEG